MKKIISAMLSASIMITMLSGTTAFSKDQEITVEIDGNIIEFDVNPEIIEGYTMVPLRKIFEEIGAVVKWDNDTKTVSARKNKKTITLKIDSTDLQIDKGDTDEEGNPIVETINLEVPAQVVSGRTLVPARAISESFGLLVDWDEDNKKVIITSDDDEDDSWKENVGKINLTDLSFEGDGIEILENQMNITSGGDFTITGTLDDGNITVSTKERVKLRLGGAKITSSENPCIFVKDADKVYITLEEGTENNLVAKNSDDGAIYSKENLEIKGSGTLNIESMLGHAIKASDNLTIENGVLNLKASGDGIHINDTFTMKGGTLNITSVGDGIDSESIVNISGGILNIETTAVPLENSASSTLEEQTESNVEKAWMFEETAEVEFEKSSKGINAEWMMAISGGEVTVDSASHAIHCQDEIDISGGKFSLSSKYEKGISAHGNLIVSGSDTVIDVTKSTEGIESKNVMTINDGAITVVSTDDAINATGGNSGTMHGMGPGGMRGDKENDRPWGNTDETGNPHFPMGNRGNRPSKEMQNGENQFVTPEFGEFPPMPPEGETPMWGERPMMPDGEMPPMGQNMGRNMKDCLIINGGVLVLSSGDDCLDANGNLVINGGTLKATKERGSFSGPAGIIDPDGRATIGEDTELILAASGGNERSLSLTQNSIILYCDTSHDGEIITLKDSNDNVICEYTPDGSYSSVLIASNSIEIGEIYTVSAGDESYSITIEAKQTVIGEQKTGMFGRGQRNFIEM